MTTQHDRIQMRSARGEGAAAALSVAGAAGGPRAGRAGRSSTPASARSAAGTFLERMNYSSGPTPKDIHDFTVQLAVMIRAGISIRAALDGITEQVTNPKFRKVLLQVRADVEGGRQFSEAISRHPKLFGPLYVNMVRASELSGSFARMLDRIAAYLAQEIETRKMVVGASIYPGIIAAMAISTTVFLLTFVLPRFAGVFKGREDALPTPTKFLMALSNFMVEWWWLLLVAAAVLVGAFLAFIRTEVGGSWWDRFKISAPIVRRMFRALYISRSLQTMGELINAGVPMLDVIAITGDVSGNRHYRRLWRSVQASVRQGRKIQTQLSKSSLLPRSVIQMISAGEESGRLGEVLDEVSVFYAKALKDAIKAVTSMIEPIMIVLMGSIVGFIAMAIILPIFKMSNLASGG